MPKRKKQLLQLSLFPVEAPPPPIITNDLVSLNGCQFKKQDGFWYQQVNTSWYQVYDDALQQQLNQAWVTQNMLPGAKLFIENF